MKVKLSDLYDIGSSKRVFQSEWRKSGVPFYRAREIAKLSIDGYVNNELFIDEDLYLEYIDKYGKPEAGDVMVTGVGTLGVCYVVKPEDRFYFKDGNILWFKQKAKDRILPEYLVKAFDSKDVKEFIYKNSSGTTVGTFTIQTAKKMEILLPSIEDQRNIIQKITKIESVIKQRRQELQLLDNLIKARFVEMFGDVTTGNYKYKTCKLGDVANIGSSHRVFTTEFVEKGIPFYRGTEIGELANGIKPTNPYYIAEEHYNRLINDGSKPQIGDLLMPSICNKGQVWMIDTEEPFYYKDGRVLCVSADRRIFNTKYLEYFMRVKTLLEYSKLGSGSTFAEFKIFLLKDIDVLIPPIELQNQFADFVHQVDKSKFAVQKGLEEAQKLFDSLMQKYFS